MNKKVIESSALPPPSGTYSAAIQAGNTVYLAGQIGKNPKTGELVTGDVFAEITQVIENLQAVAQVAGGNLSNCVKINVYLTSLADFAKVNEVMQLYFRKPYPARTTVEVSKLPGGARVEMDAIVVLNQ